MNYQVGQKVKYDSGDWWFYGTISAVIENSISPCYRINVDRMVKRNCKFSITQFEFELSKDDESESAVPGKWENQEIEFKRIQSVRDVKNVVPQTIIPVLEVAAPTPEPEPEPEPVLEPVLEEPVLEPVPELEPEPEPESKLKPGPKSKSQPESTPTTKKRPGRKPGSKNKKQADQVETQESAPQPEPEAEPTPQSPDSPPPYPKRGIKGEAWDRNYEKYKAGEKSNALYTWVALNRKQYTSGELSDAKIEKLIEIDFPFEAKKKTPKPKIVEKSKSQGNLSNAWWNHKFSQWEKGERASLQQWRQKCVKLYVNGKLSQDKIERLKKIGILK